MQYIKSTTDKNQIKITPRLIFQSATVFTEAGLHYFYNKDCTMIIHNTFSYMLVFRRNIYIYIYIKLSNIQILQYIVEFFILKSRFSLLLKKSVLY